MLKEGVTLGDRYEVISRIGAGGMADVYKAQDKKLNRQVAVKVMKAEFREDTSFVAKFQKEAEAAAKMSHPNVVNVYDVGEDRGLYYIVMELVEGITLKNYIAKKGKLSVKEATSIAIQVSLGLEAAHNQGIVHRDVKPQNIMISTDGKVKLSDFGIAKAINSNTITANVMGSVHYSSPEQVRGGFSDARSDIYSLGITMYEMVTGRVPFDGDTTVSIAIKHLQEEIVPPSIYTPDLPYSLEQVILKCTQKNPERRYQTTGELIEDLKHSLIDPQGNFVNISPLAGQATEQLHRAGGGYGDMRAAERVNRQAEPRARARDWDYEEEQRRRAHAARRRMDEEEDDDEEDDGGSTGLEKALTIGGFLVGAVIIVILILVIGNMAGLFKFGRNNKTDVSSSSAQTTVTAAPTQAEAKQVKVPDLRGKTLEEATATANAVGLGVDGNPQQQVSDDYPEGQIISQNPGVDQMVDKNSTISVVVSSGKADKTIPTGLVGTKQTDASQMLEDLGLVPSIEMEYSDKVPVGSVTRTEPKEGETVEAGSTVKLYVSKGEDNTNQLHVPDLIGQDVEQAKATLSSMNLSYALTTGQDTHYKTNQIIAVTPAVGEPVVEGTTVTLTVNTAVPTPTKAETTPAAGAGDYVCYSPLSEPTGYKGGKVRLELVQGDKTTTFYEGDNPWSAGAYEQPITSSSGEAGVINVYEDGNLIAKYPNVEFEKAQN